MLGAVMFCTKFIMEALPNIHPLGMLTMAFTVVYRVKALIPLYVYVFLNGIFAGFDVWWIPYLYLWTILWGITMLLPRRMPKKLACVVYSVICSLHGLVFGALYAPVWAIMYSLSFEEMIAWIIAGISFDVLHFVGNLLASLFILPLIELLFLLSRRIGILDKPKSAP